jgi:nucleoside-diphosphate-sugar epimerase
MKVVITGGCGFLGQQLARALLQRGSLTGLSGRQEPIDALVLFDAVAVEGSDWGDARVEVVVGDIADREAMLSLCDRDDLSVFHMASVMSGGGEADFDRALRVNVDGSRNILEALRARGGQARLVFTSAVSVFGGAFTKERVGDLTKQCPQTTYGTTKAIVELLVNDYTRKGFVDGRAARLPTVIVRPGSPNAAASSFASSVVREPLKGVDVVVPVPLTTTIAVMGHRTVVACLVAMHEVDGAKLGADRAVELPSISVTVGELVASLHRLVGDRALGKVTVEPGATVLKIVETWPTHTSFTKASALGLPHDADVDAIVGSFIDDFGS